MTGGEAAEHEHDGVRNVHTPSERHERDRGGEEADDEPNFVLNHALCVPPSRIAGRATR